MSTLENRIPPPLVATLVGVMMWLAAPYLPGFELPLTWRLVVVLPVLLVGLGICLAGVLAFHRARTTVNPLHPEQASVLVECGIYQRTRNPMYLGFAIVLMAWTLTLASPFTLLGVVAFILFMNRFQIVPEERALGMLFGEQFARYCDQVRRWL